MVDVQTQTYAQPVTENPTAVIGRRIGAWCLDWIPMWVLGAVIYGSATTRFPVGSAFQAEVECDRISRADTSDFCIAVNDEAWVTDGGDIALGLLAMLAYSLFFLAVLPGVSGWSFGKLITGLRVVKQDSFETAGIGANLVRWLLWVVDAAPYCVPLVGFITGLASSGNRRVGDMAASTLVVRKDFVGRPVPVRGLTTGALSTPPPPAPGAAWPTGPASVPAPPVAAPPAPPVFPPPVFPPPVSGPEAEPEPPAPTEPDPPPDPGFVAPGSAPTTAMPTAGNDEPTAATSAIDEENPPTPEPEPAPPIAPRPGIEAPQWDAARDTYIQWDPELGQWMQWDEPRGRWIPIST